MNRNFFVADPDAFTLTDQKGEGGSPGTSVSEAEVSIVLAAVSGAMFEVGDDLPMLGSEPERAAYARNADLLAMYKYGHAATPVDLMSYDDADEQPSIFVVHEGSRQTMLAVFNWTDQPRSHVLTAAQLGLAANGKYAAIDALNKKTPGAETGLAFDSLAVLTELKNQPPHSVRLIKIVDVGAAPAVPVIELTVPSSGEAGKPVKMTVASNDSANPAIDFAWDFGDGTTETGHAVYGVGDAATHSYTHAGTFTVTVTVTGVDGQSAKKSATITIPSNVSPDFHFDQNRRAPKP
jgi:alpha-galactosidase